MGVNDRRPNAQICRGPGTCAVPVPCPLCLCYIEKPYIETLVLILTADTVPCVTVLQCYSVRVLECYSVAEILTADTVPCLPLLVLHRNSSRKKMRDIGESQVC